MTLDWDALPIALELTEVLWHPDRAAFTGRCGVHEVRLTKKRAKVVVEVALVRPAPFERARAYDQTIRGPRVLSGHPEFDREVWVTAEGWNVEGTLHALASAPVRDGLRALSVAGGSATPTLLSVGLSRPTREAIKAALRMETDLAAALALLPHERKTAPPRPTRRKAPDRIDETSETHVDEWAKERFRLHNGFVQPSTIEVDLRAHTIQVPPEAPVRLGAPLFVRRGDGTSTLERRIAGGQTAVLCRGRHKSIESIADALARLGVDVLA